MDVETAEDAGGLLPSSPPQLPCSSGALRPTRNYYARPCVRTGMHGWLRWAAEGWSVGGAVCGEGWRDVPRRRRGKPPRLRRCLCEGLRVAVRAHRHARLASPPSCRAASCCGATRRERWVAASSARGVEEVWVARGWVARGWLTHKRSVKAVVWRCGVELRCGVRCSACGVCGVVPCEGSL